MLDTRFANDVRECTMEHQKAEAESTDISREETTESTTELAATSNLSTSNSTNPPKRKN